MGSQRVVHKREGDRGTVIEVDPAQARSKVRWDRGGEQWEADHHLENLSVYEQWLEERPVGAEGS